MGKNVLILSGTPRVGGNSDVLCDQFAKGASEAGNSVEKIRIADKKIGFCTGCYGCESSGKCVQKDDMEAILDKMIDADVIVMATPVYFYTMDAQMKALIDRTVPRYTEITDKDFYFIATAADKNKASLEKTIDGFKGFAEDCLSGTEIKGIIYGTGVWQKGEIVNTKHMTEAYEMGKTV